MLGRGKDRKKRAVIPSESQNRYTLSEPNLFPPNVEIRRIKGRGKRQEKSLLEHKRLTEQAHLKKSNAQKGVQVKNRSRGEYLLFRGGKGRFLRVGEQRGDDAYYAV